MKLKRDAGVEEPARREGKKRNTSRVHEILLSVYGLLRIGIVYSRNCSFIW